MKIVRDWDVVTDGDLNPKLRKEIPSEQWDMLRAMNLLFRAEEAGDSSGAQNAYQLARPVLFGKAQTAEDAEAVNLAISMFSLPANAGTELDVLISHALKQAQLVCWGHWKLATAEHDAKRPRVEKRAVGLYCPNYQTAIAAKLILGNIRICFRCNRPFIAEKPGENCCSEKCTNAFRVARFREREKQKKIRELR